MSNRVKVLIAGEDEDFCELVHLVLRQDDHLAVVGSAPNGHELLRIGPAVSPEAVLLDLDAPGTDTMEALPELQLRLPSTALVGLAGQNGGDAIPTGQTGQLSLVLHKTDPLERLLADLYDAGARRRMPEAVLDAPLAEPRPPVASNIPPPAPPTLSAPVSSAQAPAPYLEAPPADVARTYPPPPPMPPAPSPTATIEPATDSVAPPAATPTLPPPPGAAERADSLVAAVTPAEEPAAADIRPRAGAKEESTGFRDVLAFPLAESATDDTAVVDRTGGQLEPPSTIPAQPIEYTLPVAPQPPAAPIADQPVWPPPTGEYPGNAAGGGDQMAPVTIELVVSSFGSFRSLAAFQATLEGLSDIVTARIRRFHRGTLYETLRYAGQVPLEDRLLELTQYQPVVTSSQPGAVELKVNAGDERVLEASTPE